jgi:glycerophosphoryl diester phosphodiesterase
LTLSPALIARPFAHRGLWGQGVPENALPAFEAACRSGYGIELDIQCSSDGEAMVFHDDGLERMTGVDGRLDSLTARELASLPLLGGESRIPTLAQTLDLVAGRAPMLVEIKAGPDAAGRLAARAAELLDRYQGPAAVISFDADALAWFLHHRPERARGLDAMGLAEAAGAQAFERACESALPDFLVLEKASATTPLAAQHRANGRPVVAWTVRSLEEAARLGAYCDSIIFEGFPA